MPATGAGPSQPWAGPGLHRARQDGGRGAGVRASDPRIAAHRPPAADLIFLGLPGPNQVMGRRAWQGRGPGGGRRRRGWRDGGPARRLDPDRTRTPREPEVMRGRPPAEPPRGPGRDGGSQGPRLEVFRPGPSPEERREPCLPGLGEAHFRGEGGTASLCRPHDPRAPRPAPPGLHPRCPSPGRFGKTLSGPSALPRSRPGVGRQGAGEEEPGDPQTPGATCAHLCTWRRAAPSGTSLPQTSFCFQPCSSR